MATDTWRGEDNPGQPRIGNKVRKWYALALRESFELNRADKKNADTWQDVSVDELMARFDDEDIALYIQYKPHSSFQGPGFAIGAWVLNRAAINERGLQLLEQIRDSKNDEHDAALCSTLDGWLRADIDNAFRMLQFAGGSARLPKATRELLAAKKQCREARRPRKCRGCGDTFTNESPKRKRCVRCCAIVRWQRIESIESRGHHEYAEKLRQQEVERGYPVNPAKTVMRSRGGKRNA